jgi:nucleotide-binding universal stress UspA family protein
MVHPPAYKVRVAMFRKVLYPTDFSVCAQKALGALGLLRKAGCEEVVVLHVLDEGQINIVEWGLGELGEPVEENLSSIFRRRRTLAEERLSKVRAEIEAAGMQVTSLLRQGVPFREILGVADEEEVSLVVIGSHGRSNIGEVLLGSVCDQVVNNARQSVLVVKRDPPCT